MTTDARAVHVTLPLESLFDLMSDGVFVTDELGRRAYSNRALNELVGNDGRDPSNSIDPPVWLPAAQHARYRKYRDQLMAGEVENSLVSLEWSVYDADGHEVPVVLRLIPVGNGGLPSAGVWLVAPAPAAPFRSEPSTNGLETVDQLSKREREVLDRLLQGHRASSVARLLGVSIHTVRNHLKSIFRKLDVHSQAELIDVVRQEPAASR